jgi:2-amino-4-hydroxy-6-hydroxymethyldihydropteridine diphosphokinase
MDECVVHRAYLSLGSNLEPEIHLRAALAELRARFRVFAVSPVYRSTAVGFDGPDFLNLAAGIETDLDPSALDAWLHALEDRHGRRRDVPRYASRTLDVDIVLFDDLILDGPGHLKIPRPELDQPFVLVPLSDIAPDVRDPVSGRTLLEKLEATGPTFALTLVPFNLEAG